jgi:hypothetical protein
MASFRHMNDEGLTRRELLGVAGLALVGCRAREVAASDAVLEVVPLAGMPWPTFDPFLFCVHHDDAYPAGNEQLGPAASLEGRTLARTSRLATAGTCTTAARCPASRSTRTAASRR